MFARVGVISNAGGVGEGDLPMISKDWTIIYLN